MQIGALVRRGPGTALHGPGAAPGLRLAPLLFHIDGRIVGMSKRDGRQKGAQTHAEGQHGSKAHAHFIRSLHEPHVPPPQEDAAPREGTHRLGEDREQHDEAERNSEKNRG